MSVNTVAEVWSERGGTVDERGVRRYTRVFRVTTSSTLDGPLAATAAPGIPRRGDLYAEGTGAVDLGVRCLSVTARPDQDDPRAWLVVAEYTSSTPDGAPRDRVTDPAGRAEDPVLRPTEVEWGWVKHRRTPTKARYGAAYSGEVTSEVEPEAEETAFLNSAGDRLTDVPEVDDSRPTLRVTRNQAAFDPSVLETYKDAINKDSFAGFGPRKCKVTGIEAKSSYENGLSFWRVTYTFEFNPRGWRLELLDHGFRAKPSSVSTDRNAQVNNVGGKLEVLLDGTGVKLADGADPVYLFYYPYREVPFAPLGIF